MSSYNKVIIMGRLTRDPELRVTPNGNSVCAFSVATSRKFKGADGSMREETTFIDIDSFGKQAEVIAKYFNKGKPIFVEGRLKLDQWESNGEKRSKLKVMLETFQFVGGKDDAGSFEPSNNYEAATPPVRSTASVSAGVDDNNFDDDVPF